MSDFSNYLENVIVNHFFRNTSTSSPAAVYVALATAISDAETGNAGGTEVPNSFAYQRTAVTFGAPSNGVSTNSGDVTFPTASGGSWGTVTHFAIFDSQTHAAGNALTSWKALTASKTIADGDTAKFTTGNLSLTVA
jgi:hypothetical protein